MLYLRSLFCTLMILLVSAVSCPADTINYNDNCDGSIPNTGGLWFGRCPDPEMNETNWVGNVIPGETDDAAIGPQYELILVNGYATVLSVQAHGGLVLDASIYSLTLTSGGSIINGLRLTSSADITAQRG